MTERKRLEREVLEISAAERREIGFDLHDGVGQHLAGTAFKAKLLEETLAADFPQLARSAREVVGLINAGIDQVRRVARGLDPIEVEATGLEPALNQLADDTRTVFGIPCVFRCTQPAPRFDSAVSLQLYRIAQEAIHNALVHGRAKRVEIELAFGGTRTSLMIADDGHGFREEATSRTGMGLRTMEYRARAIGGFLLIDSQVNRGTRITCLVQTPRGGGQPLNNVQRLAPPLPVTELQCNESRRIHPLKVEA
jgi:signal transduction histidine kinase